jgi:hypothetical protein
LDLQHAAGNRAVSQLVQSRHTASPGNDVPPIVRSVLNSGGQPLDSATRAFMESRFGHDLSQVRVHTDGRAAESAREVHALAYTVGPNIVFGADEYAPTTHRGRGLLAHELAHTIQQRSTSGAPPSAEPHGIFESSANAAGRDVANGRGVSGDLPACGIGLSLAPVPLEELPDEEIQENLKKVTEKLKKPSYEGRERDLDWSRRLIAAFHAKAKAREPVAPPPPPPPPAPDPRAERAAAAAEAEAVLAPVAKEAIEDDDDEGDVVVPMSLAPIHKGAPRRRKTVPQLPKTLPYSMTDEQIYGDLEAQNLEWERQIHESRIRGEEPRQKGSFDERYRKARMVTPVAVPNMTWEDIWRKGREDGYFGGYEEERVREEFEGRKREKTEATNRQLEIDKYNSERNRFLTFRAQMNQGFIQGTLVGGVGVFGKAAAVLYKGYQIVDTAVQTRRSVAQGDYGTAVVISAPFLLGMALSRSSPRGVPESPGTTGVGGGNLVRAAPLGNAVARTAQRFEQMYDVGGRRMLYQVDIGSEAVPGISLPNTSAGVAPTGTFAKITARVIDPETGAPLATQEAWVKIADSPTSPPPPSGAPAPVSPVTPSAATGSIVEEPKPLAVPGSTVVNPSLPPATRRTAAADKRVTETEKVLAETRDKVLSAQERFDKAKAELDTAIELKAEGGGSAADKSWINEQVKKHRTALRDAKSELRDLKKTEASAASEAEQVAHARTSIAELEQKIADIDRKMREIVTDPKRTDQLVGRTSVPPPTSTAQGQAYRRLKGERVALIEKLNERTTDLTRSVRAQVAQWTPGPKARPDAITNAQTIPGLVPENGTPIDVTTGTPMATGTAWSTDHIMSRNEIASDPRFILLDSAGRDTMINGITENFLPITIEANSSKLNLTMNQWLAARTRNSNPIPPRMAAALREADKRARAAVEAMFIKLLGP